ncbi:MAG: hypothetical protein KDA21_10675, partial [Phycisphaerales bacterium]|nr:hypothetical protein [Phycisphaerales bacterium]
RQQDIVALPGIAAAAAASWSGAAVVDPRAVSLHRLGDRTLHFASWLEELGDVDEPLRAVGGKRDEEGRPRRLRNASALFEDMHPSGAVNALPGDAGSWWEVVERLESLRGRMPRSDRADLRAQAELTLDTANFAARRAALRREGGDAARKAAPALADLLESIMTRRRRLWLRSYRMGGLDESLGYETKLLEACRAGVLPPP